MLWKTHLIAGFILSFFITTYFPYVNPLLTIIIVLLGSIIPDIDHSNSLLGRRMPLVSIFFKHRGFFHSLILCVGIMVLLSFLLSNIYVWFFGASFILHLSLDALTPQGVRPFWPSRLRIRSFIRAGGFVEKIIFVIMIILFVYLMLRSA